MAQAPEPSVVLPFPAAPGREIELKLDLTPTVAAKIETALAAFGGRLRSLRMISAYYDDERQSLRRGGLSLRVREIDGRFVQTVKTAGDGLLARGEWECALIGPAPDLEAAADTPAGDVLSRAGAIGRVFTSRVERTERTVTFAGAEIELAVDRGEIRAGARRLPVCQLELELKRGSPAALFALAGRLAEAAPVRLSFTTKADMGYGLAAGPAKASAKSGPAAVVPGMTAGQAFQAVAGSALRQIVDNAALLRARRTPEAAHQLRVGLRRLRTAMVLFRDLVADEAYADLRAELKWMSGALDRARDTDVFIAETYSPSLDILGQEGDMVAVGERLEEIRAQGYDLALRALASRRGSNLPLRLAEWIEAGAWTTDDALARARDRSARAFARRALPRLRRKVKSRGRRLARLAPAERHELRIAVKKLRYGLEFLGPLLPARRTARFTQRLKALQESLGALNDIALARRTAASLAPELSFVAGLVAGLRAADQPRLLCSAKDQYAALVAARTPW